MRHNFGAARATAGLQSRKKRKRVEPPRFETFIGKDENNPFVIERPGSFPKMILSEVTAGRPELLVGPIHGNGIRMATGAIYEGGPPQFGMKFQGRGGDQLRLIAKIAHGFTAALIDVETFEPFLTSIILNKSDAPPFWTVIGSELGTDKKPLHWIGLRVVNGMWHMKDELGHFPIQLYVVEMQLFGNFSAPFYEVVVGRKIKF